MIKHFCDICGKEIIDDNKGSIFVKGNRVYSKILVNYSRDEICPSCINSVMVHIGEIRKENEK